MNLSYVAEKSDTGLMIKSILKNKLNLSGNIIKRLKNEGGLTLNGNPCFVIHKVAEGDVVEVNVNFRDTHDLVPEDLELKILYEDEAVAVVDKPAGIVVHPTYNYYSGTIANGLAHHYMVNNIQASIRPVSRLDRETSGIIVFAKNEYVQNVLTSQAKCKIFIKSYIAVVAGIPSPLAGTIDLPIAREEGSIITRKISSNGATAVTHYEVVKEISSEYSLVKFILETGRTHQIRVHCKAIGHPIVGDTLYGLKSNLIKRQALHASEISFEHPYTNEPVTIRSEFPEDINVLIIKIE